MILFNIKAPPFLVNLFQMVIATLAADQTVDKNRPQPRLPKPCRLCTRSKHIWYGQSQFTAGQLLQRIRPSPSYISSQETYKNIATQTFLASRRRRRHEIIYRSVKGLPRKCTSRRWKWLKIIGKWGLSAGSISLWVDMLYLMRYLRLSSRMIYTLDAWNVISQAITPWKKYCSIPCQFQLLRS